MLDQAERLSSWGFALHWLRSRSKAPVNDSWSTERVASLAILKNTYREGRNLGVRLGEPSKIGDLYLHVIDLDIRDKDLADEAWAALLELIPEARKLPSVISGSMGESRHLYFLTDRPFPSKKLRHSTEKIIGADGKSHWAWEIERFGTGKQVVVPPSIHPDTGKRYRWEREWRADMVDMVELGLGPTIEEARVASWEPPSRDETGIRTNPLGLTIAQAKEILADLPTDRWCEDRDGWLQVGMALHHEFDGTKEGFEAWCEFSAASDKYDSEDQHRVWASFHKSNRPVRMATLKSAARDVRLMRKFDDLGDEETDDADNTDVDDLLGGTEPSKSKTKKPDKIPELIAAINKRHAFAFINGKDVVLTFNKNGTVSYGTVAALLNLYSNVSMNVDGKKITAGRAWMDSEFRLQYKEGVVFDPQGDPKGGPGDAYNHWRGFAVQPDPLKSCDLFLGHMFENICNGDQRVYDWVIRWFAHMVQRPWESPVAQ